MKNFILRLIFVALGIVLVNSCRLDKCIGESYEHLYQIRDDVNLKGPWVNCGSIRNIEYCLQNFNRDCQGELQYHAVLTVINTSKIKLNCTSQHKGRGNHKPVFPLHWEACTYNKRVSRLLCGLYGDPHLKTFHGEYQTCRTIGAWPLIDNDYIAVQVTNEPINLSSNVTTVTKITIMIKSRKTNCVSEKTYEATSNLLLPSYFIATSDKFRRDENLMIRVTGDPDNQKAEIHLRYIDTIFIIRRVKGYLGISISMPEDLINPSAGEDIIGLCSRGCPSKELLDMTRDRGNETSKEYAQKQCLEYSPDGEAIRPITDNYLDWCIFDVMTGGHEKGFITAAYSALEDAKQLDPLSIKNRTKPLNFYQISQSSHAIATTGYILIFNLLLALFC